MLFAHLPTEPPPDPLPEPEPEEPIPIDEPEQPGEYEPVRDPLWRPPGVRGASAFAALCATFLCLPNAGAMEFQQGVSERGVPYLAGGVGEESRQEIMRRGQEYNLKLVFAQTDGAYLADVRVLVVDGRGATLLDTQSSGPFLLARLPPGRYRISASLDERQQYQSASLTGAGQQQLIFRW